MTDVINEILLTLRERKLDYRASPTSETGPWHAQCPACRRYCQLDELPLTITADGSMRCKHGCSAEDIASLLIPNDAEPQTVATRGLRLLSVSDLAELPPPSWLLDDILPIGFNVLFGPSNVGKSFLALDWALCIASGLPWYGKLTEPCTVAYVAAEGVSGLYQRVQAWMHARHQVLPPDRIRFIPSAVNFLEAGEVDQAQDAISALDIPPRLIVVDTMARSMVGGDENTSRDVGRFIAGVDTLRATFDAAALIVHHTGRDGEDERGSTALRGASDAMIALKPDGGGIKMMCSKQKDAAPFEPWQLHLEPTLESCVLRLGTNSDALAPIELQILDEVSAAFGTNWTTPTAIKEACGVAKSSYYRSLKALVDRGFLQPEGDQRNARMRLTAEGVQALVPASPRQSHGTGPSSPTPRGSLETLGLGTETETPSQRSAA